MSQETIIEKIKKLLEINRANGATEAEEAAAMERANALMTKYQIEMYQVRGNIKTKTFKSGDHLRNGHMRSNSSTSGTENSSGYWPYPRKETLVITATRTKQN